MNPKRQERLEEALRHLPTQIEIVEHIFNLPCRKATDDEDREEATDLVCGHMTIAAKVRAQKYIGSGDFALRSHADGYDSEWQKMTDGKCDLLLNTYQNEKGEIIYWRMIDLVPVRRAALNRWVGCRYRPGEVFDPENDIYVKLVKWDGFNELFGRIVITEGAYPF